MNGCRRAMGRDWIASRATRPKSMSVLRHAVVKRSRKDIGPLSRSTIEGRHPETSRFFRYEPDRRRPQRRCLVSSCVKIGAPTMRALNDHRKRSEERRVGKECRSRWWPDHRKKKTGIKTKTNNNEHRQGQ